MRGTGDMITAQVIRERKRRIWIIKYCTHWWRITIPPMRQTQRCTGLGQPILLFLWLAGPHLQTKWERTCLSVFIWTRQVIPVQTAQRYIIHRAITVQVFRELRVKRLPPYLKITWFPDLGQKAEELSQQDFMLLSEIRYQLYWSSSASSPEVRIIPSWQTWHFRKIRRRSFMIRFSRSLPVIRLGANPAG